MLLVDVLYCYFTASRTLKIKSKGHAGKGDLKGKEEMPF
jgi:hypothetical protein